MRRGMEFIEEWHKSHSSSPSYDDAIEWADQHPNGFINNKEYLDNIWKNKDITNKEFIELLQQFPMDAQISIEYCSPRAMVYDKVHNLIRID